MVHFSAICSTVLGPVGKKYARLCIQGKVILGKVNLIFARLFLKLHMEATRQKRLKWNPGNCNGLKNRVI